MAEQEKPKIKVLWLSDFNCATGFAQVAQNLVKQLQATGLFEFTVVGINHHGEPYDMKKWPFAIFPARDVTKAADQRYMDPFGRQRMLDLLGTGEFDILFTLQDTFVMENVAGEILETKKQLAANQLKPFKWIFYYPIDSVVKENWITKSAALADFPVAYTNFGKDQTKLWAPEKDIDIVYHGVDMEVFKPLPAAEVEAFRDKYFSGNAKGKFIVTNINRNQRRKDIPRTIAAFAELKKQRPESLLYMHMNPIDVGGSIYEMARHFGLVPIKDFAVPNNFNEQQGYPLEVVNLLYNVSDVIVSTTLGEGWGLSVTEAMAVKKPVIFPNNTSLIEICADGRGKLVPSGATVNDWLCLGQEDMNQFRPVTDVREMGAALIDAYDNREKYAAMAEKAYEWVQQLSWENLGTQWLKIFHKAFEAQQAEIKLAGQKLGRNDLCPVCQENGQQRKWKKCREHNADAKKT